MIKDAHMCQPLLTLITYDSFNLIFLMTGFGQHHLHHTLYRDSPQHARAPTAIRERHKQ
jgi:hypothetical protein